MATGTKRRRGIRLTATLTMVVLALTGFQTTSHGKGKSGKSKSSSSSGGGCSSSKKKNDDYDSDDLSGSSGGSDYTSSPTPTVSSSPTSKVDVVVVDCVKPAQKKRKGKPARRADTTASLRITSRETFTETFKVTLEFQGSVGTRVDSAERLITVEPGESKDFEVAMKTPKSVDKVKSCSVWDVRKH
ncbi:hypothetical protein [Streptomyces sp. NBC_01353]|uniref:hypothetical protein n=1 Tax=Streptomyces sp. NBC_01353 TaxID=2903835 RepID=UPI002E2F0024|nr:hypothetical protein [Streptomyces sp. NBC_01353]